LPVVIAVPEPLSARDARVFLEELSRDSAIAIAFDRSEVIAQGRAGGAAAVARACERLSRGDDEAIAVGGVDSFYDPDRLEALDRAMRLHGPACENGFIPGEGAAFALLAHRRRAGSKVLGQILGASTEREPRPYGSEEPCHGLGMSTAMKRAVSPLGSARIGWALTDVVGERHRVEEFLYVTGRLHEHLTDLAHDQPLMRTGDLGAASGVALLVLACVGFQTGTAKAPAALVMVHADGAERGAFVVAEESR
jgi:3-oxoacyl-[acyl-carrier-protein] synthase-1